jgi:hypothetical protein
MPSSSLFPDLPDSARCWIHVADAPIDEETQAALCERVRAFIDGWSTHGTPVRGAVTVLDDRFLVVAGSVGGADADANAGISGCGIDDAVNAVETAAEALGISWAPALHVVFRNEDGAVETLPRPAFRERIGDGGVTTATPVFDPSLTRLGDLRSGAFEQPAGSSWHARVFNLPEAPSSRPA